MDENGAEGTVVFHVCSRMGGLCNLVVSFIRLLSCRFSLLESGQFFRSLSRLVVKKGDVAPQLSFKKSHPITVNLVFIWHLDMMTTHETIFSSSSHCPFQTFRNAIGLSIWSRPTNISAGFCNRHHFRASRRRIAQTSLKVRWNSVRQRKRILY